MSGNSRRACRRPPEMVGAVRGPVLAAALLLVPLADGVAQPAGDPATGLSLARAVCSACHLVAPDAPGPLPDGVPTFVSIAQRLDDAAIEARLLAPAHPAMPEVPLGTRDRAHLIAYLRSLAAE